MQFSHLGYQSFPDVIYTAPSELNQHLYCRGSLFGKEMKYDVHIKAEICSGNMEGPWAKVPLGSIPSPAPPHARLLASLPF